MSNPTTTMNILAIDPGPTESAWCFFAAGTPAPIRSFQKCDNTDLVNALAGGLFIACEKLVIEQVASMGMAAGESLFETCFWSGRFAQAWGRPFARLKRHQIKMHLCGTMRAKDGNIRQALIDKFGPQGTKKSPGPTYGLSGDCWAALAVAVTFAETEAQAALTGTLKETP